MNLTLLVVLAFANWRLASLLAREEGPYGLLPWLRHKLGVRHDEYHEAYGTNVVSQGVICIWCNSFWIGVFQTLYALFLPEVALWLFLPLALSTGAIILEVKSE